MSESIQAATADAAAAAQRYLDCDRRDAAYHFASEFQGWFKSELDRGATWNETMARVLELLTLLLKANPEA